MSPPNKRMARSMWTRALVVTASALTVAACSKKERAANDDGAAISELAGALKPLAEGFDTAKTTDCRTARVRELGPIPSLLIDVEVVRALLSGAPAPSRLPLAQSETLPTQDIQGVDAATKKKLGDAARYAMKEPLWGLYHLDELELPAIGMLDDQAKSFTPGRASLSINLIERATGTNLCTVKISVETPRLAKVVTNQAGEVVRGPADALRDEARRALDQRLGQLR